MSRTAYKKEMADPRIGHFFFTDMKAISIYNLYQHS